MEYHMSVQCNTIDGATGDFIHDDENPTVPLSPVFDSLAKLFPWIRENGWKLEEYRDNNYSKFEPWRIIKLW